MADIRATEGNLNSALIGVGVSATVLLSVLVFGFWPFFRDEKKASKIILNKQWWRWCYRPSN
jgi:hypothetical protein